MRRLKLGTVLEAPHGRGPLYVYAGRHGLGPKAPHRLVRPDGPPRNLTTEELAQWRVLPRGCIVWERPFMEQFAEVVAEERKQS